VVVSGRAATALQIVAAAFTLFALTFLAFGFYIYYLSTTLPDLEDGPVMFRAAETSLVYAADGSVIAEWHAGENRIVVPLKSVAESMKDAVIASQDPRFFEHRGIDVDAILAAVGIGSGNGAAMGSTITQQVVRMLFGEKERDIIRKAQEVLLAHELNTRADKDAVLATYLNQVYFGHGAYGIEAAADRFFGVNASELTLAQSALLAALIDSPGARSPINAPEIALRERNRVLELMREEGFITPEVSREAIATELAIAPRGETPNIAPFFLEYVKQLLSDELGDELLFTGGLRIHTTLHPALQAEAEQAARRQLGEPNDPEYALVAIESRTGKILAMVGGRDFAKNQFNLAVQGRRQPGSAFKTFVLAEAIARGIPGNRVFDATPWSVRVKDGIWTVNNYENESTAPRLSLQAATDWSVNAVYARLIMQLGPESVVDMARRAGITSPLDPNPAIALGGLKVGVSPLEMTSAYGTFANGGLRVTPMAVTHVTDAAGDRVWTPDVTTEQVIEERVARQISAMLQGVVTGGTGTAAQIPGVWVAGKTGTTQSYRDAWFVGFTQDIVCGVWVGYREGHIDMTDVRGTAVSGGSFPARIWSSFMSRAHTLAASVSATPVAGSVGGAVSADVTAGADAAELIPVTICPESARIAGPGCPSPEVIYLQRAAVPSAVCNLH